MKCVVVWLSFSLAFSNLFSMDNWPNTFAEINEKNAALQEHKQLVDKLSNLIEEYSKSVEDPENDSYLNNQKKELEEAQQRYIKEKNELEKYNKECVATLKKNFSYRNRGKKNSNEAFELVGPLPIDCSKSTDDDTQNSYSSDEEDSVSIENKDKLSATYKSLENLQANYGIQELMLAKIKEHPKAKFFEQELLELAKQLQDRKQKLDEVAALIKKAHLDGEQEYIAQLEDLQKIYTDQSLYIPLWDLEKKVDHCAAVEDNKLTYCESYAEELSTEIVQLKQRLTKDGYNYQYEAQLKCLSELLNFTNAFINESKTELYGQEPTLHDSSNKLEIENESSIESFKNKHANLREEFESLGNTDAAFEDGMKKIIDADPSKLDLSMIQKKQKEQFEKLITISNGLYDLKQKIKNYEIVKNYQLTFYESCKEELSSKIAQLVSKRILDKYSEEAQQHDAESKCLYDRLIFVCKRIREIN